MNINLLGFHLGSRPYL